MISQFSRSVIALIKSIPPGGVSTYGRIAAAAGNPRGARQVARLLHSSSKKHNLPWHRVINSQGRISLPYPGSEEQKALLLGEGVEFLPGGRVDLEKFGFFPGID